MKALTNTPKGPAPVEFREVAEPKPAAHEALIAVHAFSLNRGELTLMRIRPEGWSIWGGNENHRTARYVEYKNTGPGAARDKRVEWSKELSDDEAAKYTVENILAGPDHWKP